MHTIRTEELSWIGIKDAIEKGFDTVVIAVGSIEQHGPHLPTQTDALIGDILANRIASRLKNALQAPTIRVGCSEHHMAFPGTISYKESTLRAIIHDYVESLTRHGFKTIIFLPSHGGNFKTVEEAIKELQQKYPEAKITGYTDLMGFIKALHSFSNEFGITTEEAGVHAGENETSIVLALAEELVEEEGFAPGYIGPFEEEQQKTIFEKGMTALTENGVLGDPTKATVKYGEVYFEKMVDFLLEEIQKLI